jgi:hypothetical protein
VVAVVGAQTDIRGLQGQARRRARKARQPQSKADYK